MEPSHLETMVAAEIEKWWAVMRADSQKSVQMCGEYQLVA